MQSIFTIKKPQGNNKNQAFLDTNTQQDKNPEKHGSHTCWDKCTYHACRI